MNDRIRSIKGHENYWALYEGRIEEFVDVNFKLNRIASKKRTNKKDRAYLERVERELERLNPGVRTYLVEGEERKVPTLYMGED